MEKILEYWPILVVISPFILGGIVWWGSQYFSTNKALKDHKAETRKYVNDRIETLRKEINGQSDRVDANAEFAKLAIQNSDGAREMIEHLKLENKHVHERFADTLNQVSQAMLKVTQHVEKLQEEHSKLTTKQALLEQRLSNGKRTA